MHSKVTVIFTILELHENEHGVRIKASLECEKIQDVRAAPGSKMLGMRKAHIWESWFLVKEGPVSLGIVSDVYFLFSNCSFY